MRNATRTFLAWASLAGLLPHAGCLVVEVPEDRYASDDSYDSDESPSSEAPSNDAGKEQPTGPAGPSDAAASPGPGFPAADAALMPPNPDCDFSGRWIATERRVATGLGVKQAGVYWLYYELAQSGDQLRVQKGLACGTVVKPIDALAAKVVMEKSWPLFLANNPMTGRTGSIASSASDCSFKLNRFYTVMGASADYYRDPKRALPTIDQKATGSTPGWEDYDHDGNPGSTLTVSGILNGTMQTVIRGWGEYAGTVPKGASKFQLPLDWNQDMSLLAVSSEPLKTQGVKDGDRRLHFVQFARLSDAQATGDDATVCKSILALAPQLTPDADK
jgi:hypothetical protein